MLKDKICTYEQLLEKFNYTTWNIRCLRTISTDVFKSLNCINPRYMKEMLNIKETSDNLRDLSLMYQPSFTKCMDLDTFKTLITSWNGPRLQCSLYNVLLVNICIYRKYLFIKNNR